MAVLRQTVVVAAPAAAAAVAAQTAEIHKQAMMFSYSSHKSNGNSRPSGLMTVTCSNTTSKLKLPS